MSIRPVKSDKVVVCLERGANDPADATAIPSSFASLNADRFHLSGARLPRLSWKRPKNGSLSVFVYSQNVISSSSVVLYRYFCHN